MTIAQTFEDNHEELKEGNTNCMAQCIVTGICTYVLIESDSVISIISENFYKV